METSDLPPGWQERVDNQGRKFYVDHVLSSSPVYWHLYLTR